MTGWYHYLKKGFEQTRPRDTIGDSHDGETIISKLRILHPYLKKRQKAFILGAGVFAGATLLSFPQPLIIRYIVDHIILGHRLKLLFGAVLLVVGISIARRLLNLWKQFYFKRLEMEMILDIREDLFERLLELPKAFFDDKQTGYLMSRISSDVEKLRWFFSTTLLGILENILRFLGGIGLLVYLEWKLAVVVVLVLPAVGFLVRFFSRKISILSHREMEQQAKVSSRLQEMIANIPLIKAFSSEQRTRKQLMHEFRSWFQISLAETTVGSLASLVINSTPDIARVIVLAAGAYWVIRGDWTLGSLYAFQAYLSYVYGPAQFLATSNLQLQTSLAALSRVRALFGIIPEENVGSGLAVAHLNGHIRLENVSFSYDGREKILEKVSLRIRAGEHVGIVGPSGIGKTTLVSLLLCFYKPSSGVIYFDERPVSEFEVRSLRRRIGYVSQEQLLLSGTIMENLRYGNQDADDEQIFQAAQISGLKDFIEDLPAGYHTVVGERGAGLSEGQKQRLSIARALIRDPDILILDEPTASLDGLTEKSIFGALPKSVRHKTLIVVAHRLSTVKDLDRILLLDEQRRVLTGTHQSLLKTSQYYRSVVTHQYLENSGT